MTDTEAFIRHALARCRRVAEGARELEPLFGSVMPFAGHDLADLQLVERTAATAFLKRFEQLQDLIGRVVRAMSGWEGEDAGAMTHRDLANWLEKRGAVHPAERWMVTVRLRNRLVHEYPIEEAEQILRLNECWSLMPLLHIVTDHLGDYAEQKGIAA